MAHYKDLIGSELRLNTRSYRRQSALRRGVITEIGDSANQQSLATAAQIVATALGDYHPSVPSLPLQNISIRRIGADRAEYAAEYGHVGSSFNDNSRVVISEAGRDRTPGLIPWGSEVDSGRRWTPNEYPPFYASSPVSYLNIDVTETFGTTSAVQALINNTGLINKVNASALTLGGVVYPAQSIMFVSFSVDYDPGGIANGVDLTYRFIMRRFNDADGNSRGWVQGGYQKISARPYWQAVWVPLAVTADLSSLPGI